MAKKFRHLAVTTSFVALAMADPAWAQCMTTTSGGVTTITCANAVTENFLNENQNNPSTTAYWHRFSTTIDATIPQGATITGRGLFFQGAGSNPVTVTNNGTVSHTAGETANGQPVDGLSIAGNGGLVTYRGNGSATSNANPPGLAAGLSITNSNGGGINIGSEAAPITGAAFSGESAVVVRAPSGSFINAWFHGGSFTSTNPVNIALELTGLGNVSLVMTGQPVLDGGLNVGVYSNAPAASAVSANVNARITETSGSAVVLNGVGGGTSFTLASGGTIAGRDAGVTMFASGGETRLTTAAGTTIDATGAAASGILLQPSAGSGSIVADLSGAVTSAGTGLSLVPANGSVNVTIREGGAVGGNSFGINVLRVAGRTGVVDILNLGTISSPGTAAAFDGTLRIGNGGTTGTISGNIINRGTLIFNRSDTLAYGQIVSGTGALTKEGAGTLTLSGANSYTGATTINGGTLLVTGSIAGAVTVNDGATLGGTGTVGATSIASGGTLAPGTSIGTLNVTGNLSFASGSNFLVEVAPSSADRVNVSGSATLAGTLTAIATGGNYTAGQFTVLSANNLTGTFGSLVTQGSFSGLAAILRYSGGNVILELAQAAGDPVWTGTVSTDWFVNGNWDNNAVPTAATNATINRIAPNPTIVAAPGALSANIAIGTAAGATGRLTIQNGGTLATSGDAKIGASGGDGAVTVTGAGSSWTIGGGLSMGVASATGSGPGIGRLNIENGAAVTAGSTSLFQSTGTGADGRAMVTGNGSILNTGALTLIGASGVRLLTVAAAATANSTTSGIGGDMLVTGAGTIWNSGALTLGLALIVTTPGQLTIADGAVVNSTSVVVNNVSPVPSGVLVEGAGSAWNMAGDLPIAGTNFSTGFVTIRNGARVNVAGAAGTVLLGTTGGIATLSIGGGAPGTTPGTLNAASVRIGANAVLSFEYAGNSHVFAPVIAGAGRVLVGGGTTILTGDSSAYTGETTIFNGATLQIGTFGVTGIVGTGGASGALGGNIVNNGQLILARSGPLDLAGLISGTGSLTQAGSLAARTTLSANNTYTGATIVNGGTLLVNGSIAASSGVTVNGGGTLGGTGTVASTGGTGTINPGLAGSIGTLTIAGNLTWDSGNFVADVGPGSSDRIQVTGNALLGRRIAAVATGGAYAPGQYTLMTMGGRAGTFSIFALDGNFGGLFASLSYTPTGVFLNLSQFNATDEERWLAAPATNVWNTGSNWNPDTVPIGTARFGPSSRTTIVFSPGTTQIGRLLFDADAPAYTFNLDSRIISQGGGSSLNILGQGIVNNSAFRPIIQVVVTDTVAGGGAALNFFNSSSAGNAAITSFNVGNATRAATAFYQASSAGTAIINNVGTGTAFYNSSTAGSATIDNAPNGFAGGVAFFDTSTAANATINTLLDLGGVAFFNSSTAGNARILNRSSSTFNFGHSGISGLGGVVFIDQANAGGATITNEAGGSAAFLGSSSAANALIVNSGARNFSYSTAFGDSSSAGSATITNNQGGVTWFQQQASAASSTIVNNQGGRTEFFQTGAAGSPTITNNNGGTTRFRLRAQGDGVTIMNNAGGIVDISEDPQQTPSLVSASVGIGSLSGAGNVFLGSRNLALGGLNRDETIGGVIADGGEFAGTGGSLTKTGTGTLTLTGANSYTGATTISAGTLQLGNGGVSGSLAGSIVNNAAFVINRIGSLTLAGVISGTGTFTQNGSVTTTLSGTSTYTGATTINGGTLLVTGAIGSSAVTVNNNATLGGTGTVGTTNIASGGTLSPGTSIGTLNIAGNLSFASGSNFFVEVGPAAADRVNVSGSATLAGTLTALGLGGTFAAREYTLLNAGGGLTGTFTSLVTQGSFGGLTPTLRYDGSSVFLVLAVGGGGGGSTTASTSETDAIIFNAPTITVQRVSRFETRIIGRLTGGISLFDQTINDAFGSIAVNNALAAARLAITTAGGPGVVVISDPVLVSRTLSSSTSSASVFSLAGTSQNVTTVTTFGPATLTVNDRRSCGAAIATLPSGTRPICGTPGGTSLTVAAGTINVNTNTETTYTVNEARTDTITDTTRETYELTGTVVPVGTVHAAVQSGLFELGSRFLARMGEEGAPTRFGERGESAGGASSLVPGGGGRGWAEFYGYRARADARGGIFAERRDARGLAGGFALVAGEGLTVGFAVDRSWLDLGVPGSGEEADVEMTQLAASARFGSGPFSLGLAFAYGFGQVDSRRTLGGIATAARYDVDLIGGTAEARYTIETGGLRLTPVAALDWVRVGSDAFAETGAFGLAAPDADRDRLRAAIGLEAGTSIPFEGGARLDLSASGRYAAILSGEERALPVAFNLAPGTPLVMRGLSERDSAILGAQAAFHLTPRLSLYVAYDGRFASGYDAHAAVAGIRIGW